MLVRRNLFCALLALMTYFVCFAHATWSSSSSSSSSNGQPQQDDGMICLFITQDNTVKI
jgi:hypothetical protein